jgi:hypothetical protein
MPITCTASLQTGLMGGVLGMAWYIATGSSLGKMPMPVPKNNVGHDVKADQVAKHNPLSELAIS